jgi:hypothetical protein
VSKDKNKKKKDKKKGSGESATASLKALAQNPVIAEVVAAGLLAAASALREPRKSRKLADDAKDDSGPATKKGAAGGSAMWLLAMDVGRQAVQALSQEVAKSRDAGSGAKKPKNKNKDD